MVYLCLLSTGTTKQPAWGKPEISSRHTHKGKDAGKTAGAWEKFSQLDFTSLVGRYKYQTYLSEDMHLHLHSWLH